LKTKKKRKTNEEYLADLEKEYPTVVAEAVSKMKITPTELQDMKEPIVQDMPDVWFMLRLHGMLSMQNAFMNVKCRSVARRAKVILEDMGYRVWLHPVRAKDHSAKLEVEWP
jgi:hypothetical protein